jgi:hypothetical protein
VNLRATAVAVLGKVGGKEVAGELAKLWEDETPLAAGVDPFRLGDQALAVSMLLAGDSLKGSGLRPTVIALKGPGQFWTATIYQFASDADRKAALKKWKAKK